MPAWFRPWWSSQRIRATRRGGETRTYPSLFRQKRRRGAPPSPGKRGRGEIPQLRRDGAPDGSRDLRLAGRGDLRVAFPVELEPLELEVVPCPGDRGVGVGHFGVRDVPGLQALQGFVEGAGQVEARRHEHPVAVRQDELAV